MDLKSIGLEGVDWIYMARDRNKWRGLRECGDESSGSVQMQEIA